MPSFEALLGELALGGLALTIATLAARGPLARRTPAHADRSDALDPYEVAYLAGGARLAVAAAVQALAARGALEVVSGTGRVRALGTRPRRLPPLEAAALLAAGRGLDTPAALEARVGEELRGLEAGLVTRGLRPTAARRRAFRLAPLAALAAIWVLAAGALAAAGGGAEQVPAVVVAIIFTVVLGASALVEPPRRTARAAVLLRLLRDRHRDAARRHREAQGLLDAHDVALFAALFGTGLVIGPVLAPADRLWRARTDVDVEIGEALDDNGDGGGDSDGGGGDGGGDGGGCGGGGCGGGGD